MPVRAQRPGRGADARLGVGADTASAERDATLPDGTRRVRGRVVTPRDSALRGVPSVWVTLHRVASDAAGPLDSVRTGADGGFTFRYRPRGMAGAIYFMSTQYGGIAYFSSALRDAVVDGERAEITVFDTTSAPVPVTVRGRHVAISRAGANGSHDVLDVYELSNDAERTAVPNVSTGTGVWSARLPAGATGFAVRPSADVPADAMSATGGRAVLRVPLAPGLKQVAFSYRLPAGAFPFAIPVEAATSVLEVLVEDPRGTVRGGGLVQGAAAAVEGHVFHRYLGQDVRAGAQVVVDIPAAEGDAWPRWAVPALIVGVGGAMTAGMLVLVGRRRQGMAEPVGRTPLPEPTADELLAQLAALDDAQGGGGGARYEEERAALKRRLADRIAAR